MTLGNPGDPIPTLFLTLPNPDPIPYPTLPYLPYTDPIPNPSAIPNPTLPSANNCAVQSMPFTGLGSRGRGRVRVGVRGRGRVRVRDRS